MQSASTFPSYWDNMINHHSAGGAAVSGADNTADHHQKSTLRHLHKIYAVPNYGVPSPNPLGTNKHVGAGWRKLRVDHLRQHFCSPQTPFAVPKGSADVGADFHNHIDR